MLPPADGAAAGAADAAGARFLTTAGITGKGMLTFFKTLQQQEYRYGVENIDPFMQTHPLSGERIANLTAVLTAAPSWNTPSDPALEERFRRVKAKLEGYVTGITEQQLKGAPKYSKAQNWDWNNPANDQKVHSYYNTPLWY